MLTAVSYVLEFSKKQTEKVHLVSFFSWLISQVFFAHIVDFDQTAVQRLQERLCENDGLACFGDFQGESVTPWLPFRRPRLNVAPGSNWTPLLAC